MQTEFLNNDSTKSFEQTRVIPKGELLKNYDEIPVGPNVRFEGAPNFTEFPAADFKPRRSAFEKKMKKGMSSFVSRTKKWWTGLVSKKKISKPVHKSTTGTMKLNKKPIYKTLKNRTHFNKSKKYDHWKNATVLEKPIKEKIYVKDLPPAITVTKEQLRKNFDEVPVGAHVHFEGAPAMGEFPTGPVKKPVGKKMKKNMSKFMTRVKKWWTGLVSKRKLRKPAMKSTKGAKFSKPTFKTLKHKTRFNKTKKYDAFRNSDVLEKPIKEKIYVKDLPPAVTVSKEQIVKNFDEVPVGHHVHFEGAPVLKEYPSAGFKKKSLPVGRQIKKNWSSFVTRTKKWWAGLTKKSPKRKASGRKRGLRYRTKFDKSKKYSHWTYVTVLEKPSRGLIPPHGSKLVTKSELVKNYDEVPVGPGVRIEGATHFTEFPFAGTKEKRLPFGKKVTKEMSMFMRRTKKWWAGLSKRKIVRRSNLKMKKPMWSGNFVKYRTMFNKTKKYNHWNLAFVREAPVKNQIYVKDLQKSQLITKAQLSNNYDEIPVGPHVHYQGAPVFTEFPTASFKPKTKAPIMKKMEKNVNTFLSRSKKYWNGLKGRRIMKKGELAMKSGMKKAGFKMSKRTKFDKTQKFDHFSHAGVLVKAPKPAPVALASEDMSPSKVRRMEEQKQNILKAAPVHKESKH